MVMENKENQGMNWREFCRIRRPRPRFWLAVAILPAAVWIQPLQLIRVVGSSMTPTYYDGELLWGVKARYCWEFRRGDVLLCRVGDDLLLKRVYALPGDEVVIFTLDDGFHLMVQSAEYLKYYQLVGESGQAKIRRFEVPENELFLLGDAANRSVDSRDFGPVPQSAVAARVIRGE